MNNLFKWLVLVFVFISFNVVAHEGHAEYQKSNLAISLAFDDNGKLWRASVKDDFVFVDASDDLGKTFSTSVKVNQTAQKIGADGEARPKIAIGPEGNIYVTWTEALKKPFAGYIWFARSVNHGESFENPQIVHQDRSEITHRFDALNVAPSGVITVIWVDKRDLIAAKAANKPYEGAAIYYAVSSNQGASFAPENKLADSSCECCRIALTNKPDGTVVAIWRHVFAGSERDHMMAEIPAANLEITTHRATYGHWKVDGCPHQGAALATGGQGNQWWGYHMAWFDGGNDESGKDATLFYARMDGDAWVSSPPKRFGNKLKSAAHPALLALGANVWLSWIEKDANKTQVWMMQSDDEGKSRDQPNMLLESGGSADYPTLLLNNSQPMLVWNSIENQIEKLTVYPIQPLKLVGIPPFN